MGGIPLMPKPRPKSVSLDHTADLKQRKSLPHEFVLDALAPLSPRTNPMFGCLAVYIGEKIVFALRDKATAPMDNGVWLATTRDHHDSLQREFPNMRSIQVFGTEVSGGRSYRRTLRILKKLRCMRANWF